MKTILVFIIIFSVVVVIHEFGHYFFAKRAGILVREFAIEWVQSFLPIKEKMERLTRFECYH